jgi:hypothetical protein
MKDKLMRAAEAHDEATAAFADIFGETLAANWFRQTQLILKEQLNKAGLVASDAGEEVEEVDLEAAYKRMQDEAAAELDRMAPKTQKAPVVEQTEEEAAAEAAKQAEEAAKKAEEEAAAKKAEEAAAAEALKNAKAKQKPETPAE